MRIGHKIYAYFPFLTGRRHGTVVDKRVPNDNEYILSNKHVYRRNGSRFLSDVDRKREYWIVELDKDT